MVKYQVTIMCCSIRLLFGLCQDMLLRGEYAVDLLLLLDGDSALRDKPQVWKVVYVFFVMTCCHLKLLVEMVIIRLFPLQDTHQLYSYNCERDVEGYGKGLDVAKHVMARVGE